MPSTIDAVSRNAGVDDGERERGGGKPIGNDHMPEVDNGDRQHEQRQSRAEESAGAGHGPDAGGGGHKAGQTDGDIGQANLLHCNRRIPGRKLQRHWLGPVSHRYAKFARRRQRHGVACQRTGIG